MWGGATPECALIYYLSNMLSWCAKEVGDVHRRRRMKKAKRDRLIPLPGWRERPWYCAPLMTTAIGVTRLLGIFRRRQKPTWPELPRAGQGRRKI